MEQEEEEPGDVCLGIGSEWSWRGCREDVTLVCGKVRHWDAFLWFGEGLGCLAWEDMNAPNGYHARRARH